MDRMWVLRFVGALIGSPGPGCERVPWRRARYGAGEQARGDTAIGKLIPNPGQGALAAGGEMEIAGVWLYLGARIHQDFLADYPDLVSGLDFILAHMSDAQREELLSLLSWVTEETPTAGELADVWYASGAYLYVEPSDMPRFFELLLSKSKSAVHAMDPSA